MHSHELQAMITADEHHWWYRGRRRILRAVLDELPLPGDPWILDAGCGSGRTLDDLGRYGRACGVDVSQAAVDAASGRGHPVRLAPVEELPFASGTFDLVTCLDVLEHTPDDRRTLRELLRVTRAGGHLVLTVPAYPRLWSAHDEVNEHYRRYTRRTLSVAAGDAGWNLVRVTHFNSLLTPVAAGVRAVHRRMDGRSELRLTPRRLDGLLELPSRAEAAAIRRGMRLPVGLSFLAVLSSPVSAGAPPRAPRRKPFVESGIRPPAARRAPALAA